MPIGSRVAGAILVTLGLLHGAPALALGAKTWVSHNGNDANTCVSPTAPCLTFAGALAKTSPGGEIGVVDPGDYGPVSITQSVDMTNDGAGEASILFGGISSGILIQGGAGDIVSLRGLLLDGQSAGSRGIQINQASAVHVQNCVIRNIEVGNAIDFGIVLVAHAQLFVSDTVIYNNGSGATSGGIWITPAFGSAGVVLDRVHLENNVIGLLVDGTGSTANGAHVVIRDSVVSGNASDGIRAITTAGHAPAFIVVERTSVVDNAGIGIHADGPRATMLLSDNTITRNGAGISATNSGQLISFGNNRNANNVGPEGAPTGTFSQM